MISDMMMRPEPPPMTDRKRPIHSSDWAPHYSDRRYYGRRERTIFGAELDGIDYDYNDRLHQFYGQYRTGSGPSIDPTIAEAAADVASQYETPRTAAWVDLYLSYLTTKDCTVHHILSQVGGDGYPYRIYGYEIKQAAP